MFLKNLIKILKKVDDNTSEIEVDIVEDTIYLKKTIITIVEYKK